MTNEALTLSPVQAEAVTLYTPPFSYCCGYIHDASGRVFSDNGGVDELKGMIAARVRGWGRIQGVESTHTPEELQDAVGEHIATALTEYWCKHTESA